MSFMGQDFIANHMKSHYRRITSAKGVLLLFLFSDKKILRLPVIIFYTSKLDSSEPQAVRLHCLKILTPFEYLYLIFLVDWWQSVFFSWNSVRVMRQDALALIPVLLFYSAMTHTALKLQSQWLSDRENTGCEQTIFFWVISYFFHNLNS